MEDLLINSSHACLTAICAFLLGLLSQKILTTRATIQKASQQYTEILCKYLIDSGVPAPQTFRTLKENVARAYEIAAVRLPCKENLYVKLYVYALSHWLAFAPTQKAAIQRLENLHNELLEVDSTSVTKPAWPSWKVIIHDTLSSLYIFLPILGIIFLSQESPLLSLPSYLYVFAVVIVTAFLISIFVNFIFIVPQSISWFYHRYIQ